MKDNNIDRRDFLRAIGAAGAATALAAIPGCKPKDARQESDIYDNTEPPVGQMTTRTFPGLDGDEVSILGYGCMRWPQVKDSEGKDVIDQEAVNRLVDYAIAHGVNYFDTAPPYLQGMSEIATGIALKRHPRDKYYIATKMSNFGDPSLEEGIRLYHQSLKNLQTDYIDYYLLHALGRTGTFKTRFLDNGLLDYLLKEREAGRIRHLGWSFHGSQDEFELLLDCHEKYHWDFVQIQLNWSDWRHASGRNLNAEYLYEKLSELQIPMVIMEPLQGGRLSKVPDFIFERLKERNPQGSIASWAFRFAGSHPMILTVLSGMTYMEHLQDNLRSYCPLKQLTDEDKEFLYDTADIMAQYPTIPCNDCKYCMPCPYGLDIPAIFLHYNKCVNEGSMPKSSQDPDYKKLRRAFLIGYDRSVPKLRQADRCIACGQCVPHCPQYIKIPAQMNRISRFVEDLKQG